MAYQRRSPQNRISAVPLKLIVPSRKKYSLRRSPHSRRQTATPPTSHASHAFSAASHDIRPVLVPLHPNLRRLPSRLLLDYKDSEMRSVSGGVQVGVKRKRVASTNENARTGGRPARGSGRLKRMRSVSGKPQVYTSDEDGSSSMEVDTPTQWSASDQSDLGEQTEDEDSTDDYLINYAEARQLQRLKKDELVRLYGLAGLSDDAEAMTKVEIIDTIISARDDIASLPPSSPPNRGDGNSSDYYSSDDGNTAGGEETDIGVGRHAPNGLASLRRRATINDMGKTNGRPFKGRSLSLGQFNHEPSLLLRKNVARISTEGSRRRSSNRSSPTTSKVVSPISPPATRLRSRKVSASTDPTSPTSKTSSKTSSRGKGKRVEFQDDELTKSRTPPKKGAKGKEHEKGKQQERTHLAEESDLTELEELEESLNAITPKKGQPSPRRLRSKDRGQGCSEPTRRKGELAQLEEEWETIKRVTPMRKAKVNMKNMKESEDEDEGEDEELDELDKDTEELEVEGEMSQEDELEESVEGDGDVAEEDEVDELVSTASTPPPRRTPLKNRLRSRRRLSEANEPSDGDDEGEEEEEEEDVELEDVEEGDEDAEGEEDIELGDEEEDEDEDEDEGTVAVSPRTLRNGKKIVSEGADMEVEEEAVEEEVGGADAEDPVDDETLDGNSDSVDDDAEGDTDDETMEDDVDLTVATAKTLVRLRRDDLVRLCETRDLEPIGTKPQLAEALLEWRDRRANDFSSPSSAGTARPPSTVRRKNKRAQSRGETLTPILLRSEHVHQDEPRTPPIKEVEPELELDLESLGLEDREIPPEKLQKLEKIGSGGFKDVYIGKLKGRRIAISEFRGQLSAMDIKELKLLGGFDHPNIVRFLGVSIPENTRETPVMIISELCSNGDLFDYVRNVNPPTLYKVMSIMLDIACGLEYLHTRKPSVIHRDCKSSNILITSRGTAKIADFGLAKVKQSTRSMVRSLVGTVNWQAPELWHAHPKYNHKVDVFSCAMVYWEMLQWHLPNKKFPWEGMNEHAIYDLVGAKRQRPSITGLRKQWSPEIVDLIERMWAHEHQDRPTISEVVETLKDLVARR